MAYSAKYYRENKNKYRGYFLKKRYGISVSDYEDLVKAQNNRCALCQTKAKGYMDVDHDHETKVVRGLLCRNCNRGLGYFKDNPDVLFEASLYTRPVWGEP